MNTNTFFHCVEVAGIAAILVFSYKIYVLEKRIMKGTQDLDKAIDNLDNKATAEIQEVENVKAERDTAIEQRDAAIAAGATGPDLQARVDRVDAISARLAAAALAVNPTPPTPTPEPTPTFPTPVRAAESHEVNEIVAGVTPPGTIPAGTDAMTIPSSGYSPAINGGASTD